jgi:HD-GYP domain-containing protein (c-di-GMP phosphodiesterase class II)
MSDTRGLLDRITAFRLRLEAANTPVTEAVEPGEVVPVVVEAESFRQHLRRIAPPDVDEGPPTPQLTDRARGLLLAAKELLNRQWAFASDPLFAAIAGEGSDPLAPYHQETVAFLDSAVRLARNLPDSPSAQLKQCTGLDGLLGVIRERLAVQERALAHRRNDADRIDRLASIYAAMAAGTAVGLPAVATLAEEILDDARHARPIRFAHAPVDSTRSHSEAASLPPPVRFAAAHAVNVAQVVARLTPFDAEWSSHPLLAVLAALLVDCGMTTIPVAVLSRAGELTPAERRMIDAHAQAGAELILRCFPAVAPLAAAVASHHERADGTGYPAGLRGTTIPTLGRLLAVADVYAALNEPRPHRGARDGRAALTEILLAAEHGVLDRDYAALLVRLSFYPVGTVVELTDGRVGVVVANHPNPDDPRAPGRPVVAVLASAAGGLLPHPEHVDLSSADRGGILRAVPVHRRRELLGHRYPDLV